MTKITLIGAGSTVFAKNLITDVLLMPELADATIALHDIDEARLATSEIVAAKTAAAVGASPRIDATTDRRRALADADYVVTTFQVGGYRPATVTDFEIPKRFGLRQTIGDTVGMGGIMRGLRTIPVLLDVCRDIEEVAGHAVLLNYVNPMAMLCWAVSRASTVPTVGLCHSVQHTAAQLAGDLGVPVDELRYRCAGINHMAFYLDLEQATADGPIDLYPALVERAAHPAPFRGDAARSDGGIAGLSDAVRYDVFRRLGYFVTESSEHFSEFVPWFIKRDRPDLIDRFGVPLDEYPRRCERQIAGWEELRRDLEDPTSTIDVRPSDEYGAGIIHSIETGQPRVVYGNVPNTGLITNLPEGCCVEVPCLVDGNGVQPTRIGELPPQLAAMMQSSVNVQALTVEAALTGRRDHVYHAAMMDPHSGAELDLEQIWELVDELLEAHRPYLPDELLEPARPAPAPREEQP
ncbi:MAG: alpha-glucosidase/alpha-galactosidase [Ilumatobacter sp.]|uniref:alpha-glucosidase/alpha-galactosidase n=1 Tax=Ilumatobacter sp. TaxID=1967498 RepID=UPI00262BB5E9|nr:alpha-glucosidase/alpha-galactosidase [Ilumatobacter sp.]MDJ0769699.1 alpha-glucosidase/alpha-galactosidase [Ilumatobacter sp.]